MTVWSLPIEFAQLQNATYLVGLCLRQNRQLNIVDFSQFLEAMEHRVDGSAFINQLLERGLLHRSWCSISIWSTTRIEISTGVKA